MITVDPKADASERGADDASGRDSRLGLAALLVEMGELYDAESEATEVLAAWPDNVRALDLIAKIKHMRGELSEAIAYWGQVRERSPREDTAQLRLGSLLQLARESEAGGAGSFVFVGPAQLWRKPAALLELEGAFRLYLARQPDEAKARCERLSARYRAQDPDLFKLAVLARSWIAELLGEREEARRILEELGRERGLAADGDRLHALARLYEQDDGRDALEKALNIYRYFARRQERVSLHGRLAALCRRLGREEEARAHEARFLELFRRRMHRPAAAEVTRIAARRYLPLHKLARFYAAGPREPASTPRERAVELALEGDRRTARVILSHGDDGLDLKYLADIAALEGDLGEATRLYAASLERDPGDLRVIGWLLERHAADPSPEVEALFSDATRRARVAGLLEEAIRETVLRPSLWRQLGVLRRVGREDGEAERCFARAAALDEAGHRTSHPVGRVLVAAVYRLAGQPRGVIHEVWADRRPVPAGRGGFLHDVLGNLTPEMSQGVRNTFLSSREYARAKWPHQTRDILDYEYTFKVTKEDEPSGGLSAGLPSALAFLSVFLGRAVRQDLASSGMLIADAHDVLVVRAIGDVEHKVRGAYNRNLRQVILPEGNRRDLFPSPLVPEAISREIVRFVSNLDEAVVGTFGEDVFIR